METVVTVRGIRKSFGSISALNGVDLELRRGEILALLGNNGAGKSTFIKVLSGLYRPDEGWMEIGGKRVDWRRYGIRAARCMGVETVYQERSLGELQPLWRNVFVGRPLTSFLGFIDVRAEKRATAKILEKVLGLDGAGMHPDASVRTLSGGERQGLAIARAMYFDASIVILDEPTTALAVNEVEKVLSFIAQIRAEGRSCIFISHELSHVYRIADRFALMEHGRITAVLERTATSQEELLRRLMLQEGER